MVLLLVPAPVDARVVGTVVRADGSPATGATVTVRVTDTGLVIFGSPEDKAVSTTKTDAAGRYGSVLPKSYVPGMETSDDWFVTASLPAGSGDKAGPRSSFEFEVNTALQEAPPLPIWEAEPAVTVDGLQARVTANGRPPAEGYATSVFLGGMALPTSAATFDLRLLEPEGPAQRSELIFGAQAAGNVTVRHAEGRTIYHQRLVTRQRTVTVALPVAPSRGSPCVVTLPGGESVRRTSCAATDGKFSAAVRAPSGAKPASVTVELTTAVDTGAVFVRGCDGFCHVEVSADGSAWTKAGGSRADASSDVWVGGIRNAGPVRFVRVATPDLGSGITEVSVWPGALPVEPDPERRPALAVPPSPPPAPPAPAEEPVDLGGVALKVLAGVLLVGAGGALALVARSRR